MDCAILDNACVNINLNAFTHFVGSFTHQFFVFVAPGNIGALETGIHFTGSRTGEFPFTHSICVSIADFTLLQETGIIEVHRMRGLCVITIGVDFVLTLSRLAIFPSDFAAATYKYSLKSFSREFNSCDY